MPRLVLLAALTFCCLLRAAAAQSLAAKIDTHIAEKAGGPLAPRSSDAEFIRRIYLDLAGRIPTITEQRAFSDDPAADKRTKRIEQILASDDYVRRMEQFLHTFLMERQGEHAEWKKFLHAAVVVNKPWDAIVREIVSPNADDEENRGAAFFYTKRLDKYGQNDVDIPGLVRDVGRLFLGIDVQCAQCHDHLFVDDYKQEYYHGLLAFVGQATIRTDKSFPAVAEKPLLNKLEFMSVFVKEPRKIGPFVPGRGEMEIPVFAKGEEFEVRPDPKTKTPGVPKFSVLKALGEQLPTAENQLFRRNIANRLWWLLMGRGLVHPLDLQHAGNPPSHPELFDLLADELAAHQFDMKWLLKEIALSETYQRTSIAPEDEFLKAPPHSYRIALEKPLLAEQLTAAVLVATGEWERVSQVTDVKNESHLNVLTERFAKAFAQPAKEPEVDHTPSVRGALFLMNDNVVLSWLKPREKNLAARLKELDDPALVAEELYRSVLSRSPTADETAFVSELWKKQGENREVVLRDLIWGLLASNEFAVNH